MDRNTQVIKDFYNRVIGYIETNPATGDKVGKDFYRRIVGYYDKKLDVTRDFYRRIVGKGDLLSSLVVQAEGRNRK